MQPNIRKLRRTMDVFGDVEEARPGELRAARVTANLDTWTETKAMKETKKKQQQSAKVAADFSRKTEKTKTFHKLPATHSPAKYSDRNEPLDVGGSQRHRPPLSVDEDSDESSSTSTDSEGGLFNGDIYFAVPLSRAADACSSVPDVFTFPTEGTYLRETENNVMTPLMHEAPNTCAQNPDRVPVRILSGFFVCDSASCQLVSLSCLWEDDGPCEAFGLATAETDEEEDDRESSSDGVFFRTSTILTYSLDIHQDSIWIKTQYAWYILRAPVKIYQALYFPFYKKEILLRKILRSILEDRHMTPDELIQRLASSTKDPLFGRRWNAEDLSHCRYSLPELMDVVAAIPGVDWNSIQGTPLLSLLLEDSDSDISTTTTQQVQVPTRKRKPATRVKIVSTTVTPTVQTVVRKYFDADFVIVGEIPSFLDEEMLDREQPRIESAGGVKYEAGDFVVVNEDDFENESAICFAQILFFDWRKKNFHARWFVHGSKTILEELAFGQELFLSTADNCRDVSVDCLVAKLNVVRISLADHASQKWPPMDCYFYSSAWDRKHPAGFIEVTDDQVKTPSSRTCSACDARHALSSQFISHTKSIIRSREYHSHDFICYDADPTTHLTCSIGQINKFIDSEDGVKVRVHILGREHEKRGPGLKEHTLFMTSTKETLGAISVLGTCQVLHISEYEMKDHDWHESNPDCFYIMSQAVSLDSPLTPLPLTEFQKCQACYNQDKESHALKSQCRAEKTLCAFDPFVGVGGLGLGLAEGCSMKTCLGVELNPSAAETMRKNYPSDTVVLTADANQVLYDAVKGREPRLACGKIDLMYSGPPCQNDSTLNRYKTDEKQPAFTTLSFLDVLRPAFFIMESVPGFLYWKLLKDTPDEIKTGHLKLVLKIIHFLGYNVKGEMMHSRSYGVPQTRDRFFIVATLPQWGEFMFPKVSHAFNMQKQRGRRNYQVAAAGLALRCAVAPGRALHEVVTVAETLSDLPQFDWKNPKKLTHEQRGEAKNRAKDIPRVSCAPDDVWGIQDADFEYETPAANTYQRRARQDLFMGAEKKHQHFTKHFPTHQVENICDIPFFEGADYRHLDQKNREWCLRNPASSRAMSGYHGGAYSRLDPDGYFHTIVTNVGPLAKQSTVLHPFCKRILTVRELARAQGFPDHFTFYSETDKIDDYHRQIGNSVPLGIAAALGRSIQDMVFNRWMEERSTVSDM